MAVKFVDNSYITHYGSMSKVFRFIYNTCRDYGNINNMENYEIAIVSKSMNDIHYNLEYYYGDDYVDTKPAKFIFDKYCFTPEDIKFMVLFNKDEHRLNYFISNDVISENITDIKSHRRSEMGKKFTKYIYSYEDTEHTTFKDVLFNFITTELDIDEIQYNDNEFSF